MSHTVNWVTFKQSHTVNQVIKKNFAWRSGLIPDNDMLNINPIFHGPGHINSYFWRCMLKKFLSSINVQHFCFCSSVLGFIFAAGVPLYNDAVLTYNRNGAKKTTKKPGHMQLNHRNPAVLKKIIRTPVCCAPSMQPPQRMHIASVMKQCSGYELAVIVRYHGGGRRK